MWGEAGIFPGHLQSLAKQISVQSPIKIYSASFCRTYGIPQDFIHFHSYLRFVSKSHSDQLHELYLIRCIIEHAQLPTLSTWGVKVIII